MRACLDQEGLVALKARDKTVSEALSCVGPSRGTGGILCVCAHVHVFFIQRPKVAHLYVFLEERSPNHHNIRSHKLDLPWSGGLILGCELI